jgi:hypothetical protein
MKKTGDTTAVREGSASHADGPAMRVLRFPTAIKRNPAKLSAYEVKARLRTSS